MHHIAFVVAEPWHTTDWSIDLGLIIRELRRMGHDASMTCTQIVGSPADYPTYEATVPQMSDPDYWASRQPTIAVVFNWLLRGDSVLRALRASGAFVIQFGDSDGLEGMRVHPQSQITRMWHMQRSLTDQVVGMVTLGKKYIRSHRKEDATFLANLETADLTTLTSEPGRQAFARFVRWTSRTDLLERLEVLRSPLAASFLGRPVLPRPLPLITAVGRWADPQKDAPLLSAALRDYLTHAPNSMVRLIGGGGDNAFSSLTRDFPQVRYLGRIPHADVAAQLAEARILLFSSRWEGVPVVSQEMVALGGTVVGPATLPGIALYAQEKAGTTARRRTPHSLATALKEEMDQWEQGNRDPEAIAARWRPLFDPASLAKQILTWAENKKK